MWPRSGLCLSSRLLLSCSTKFLRATGFNGIYQLSIPINNTVMQVSKKTFMLFLLVFGTAIQQVWAFCGFYVAKAGTELFNNKSQVIIVRDGNKNVITMANDFKGDAK